MERSVGEHAAESSQSCLKGRNRARISALEESYGESRMNFLIKSITQKMISMFPGEENLNYFFQKYVSKSLPSSRKAFFKRLEIACKHIAVLEKHLPGVERDNARLFEFGAGWDLAIPILFSAIGIRSQVIIDRAANARLELVNDTISKIKSYRSSIEDTCGMSLDKEIHNIRTINTMSDLLAEYGIEWLAPVDAANTGLPSGCFDFISNSLTLEHIPEDAISSILNECHRILKPTGIMSCCIDLKDHYSYFDSNISIYNFLKYSDRRWKAINSSIHYENRLRAPDYTSLVEKQTEFSILHIENEYPDIQEREILSGLKLDNRFGHNYSIEDLGVKNMWLVLQKN